MTAAGPIHDLPPTDEIPRCDCGRRDWSIEHSVTGRDRQIRIVQCRSCDQLGVMTGYHTRRVIDYDGSVEV